MEAPSILLVALGRRVDALFLSHPSQSAERGLRRRSLRQHCECPKPHPYRVHAPAIISVNFADLSSPRLIKLNGSPLSFSDGGVQQVVTPYHALFELFDPRILVN